MQQDYEVLHSKQAIDKLYLDHSKNVDDLMAFVAKNTERELITKLLEKLNDHKTHIVKLGEPWTENNDYIQVVEYRQDLPVGLLVQCENCKYNPRKPHKYYDNDPIYTYGWCSHFIDERNGKGFCSFGKEGK